MLKTKQIFIGLSLLAIFSFSAFAQKTPKVDFVKKIKEATPQPLPQEPVAQKLKSDAQDKNLKGKVKSVIEYTQNGGKTNREIYSEEHYNSGGNLINEISYDEGYPNTVTVWGYIDGNRVNKANYIKLTDEERPPSTRIGITISPEDNTKNPAAAKDTRYSIKHDYKYNEQGQLIEDWLYQNNGEVWTHTVYKYVGNQREELNYGNDGSEWSQTIEILDKDGNVIERNLMDAEGKVGDREINTHEFDKQGNWIVKKTYDGKIAKGKTTKKLLWTSFRTITYYP